MSITVQWIAHQLTSGESIGIYRSDTRNGTYTLLGSVQTEVDYVDTTALDNKVYYYKAINAVNGITTESNVVPLANFPDTGPGGQTLLRGNWEFGYFGRVAKANFPTFADTLSAAGGTAGNATAYWGIGTSFYKWIINGNICFFPDICLDINRGTTDLGTMHIPPNGDVTTAAKVSLNNYTYAVRAPLMSNTQGAVPDNVNWALNANNQLSTFDPTYPISEVMALLSCHQDSDITIPNNAMLHVYSRYDDHNIWSGIGSYIRTISYYTTTISITLAGNMSRMYLDLNNVAQSTFWPVYVLQL